MKPYDLPHVQDKFSLPANTLALLMACFAFATCYFQFFVFPGTPFLPGGDQILAASDGARVLSGQIPYRDFFEFLPPGSVLTYAGLIKAFGWHLWIFGLLMSCLPAIVVYLTTLVSSRIMRGLVMMLPALLFTGFILLGPIDVTHHWFSTVLVLAAMLVLCEEPTLQRIALAGILCGLAACYTQNKGAIAAVGFLAYLIWKARRDGSSPRESWGRGCLFIGAVAAIFVTINAYFIRTSSLDRWFYSLVIYPLRYYPAPDLNNWRILKYDFLWHRSTASFIVFPFVYCTVPLVYLVFLYVYRRRSKEAQAQIDERLILVALTGLAMFLAVASSPSVKRLCTVSPPAMILLAWLLNRSGIYFSTLRRGLAMAAVAAAVVPTVLAQTRKVTYLDLPTGRTAFTDRATQEEYSWILTHTHPGQFFWGLGPFYFPFELRNPASITEYDTSDYTRPETVAALVNALQQHEVPLIIIGSENTYPLTLNSPGNHLGPFVRYLRANYRLTMTFQTGYEVWEKSSQVAQPSTANHAIE